MNKQSIVVTILYVLSFSSMQAQTPDIPVGAKAKSDLPKNSFSFRIGQWTSGAWRIDQMMDGLFSNYDTRIKAKRSYSAAFKRHLNNRLAYQTAYTHQNVEQYLDDNKLRLIELIPGTSTYQPHGQSQVNWTLTGWQHELQCSWYRDKDVAFYSGAGLTFATFKPDYVTIKDPEIKKNFKKHTKGSMHFTLLGIEVGRRLAVAADIGFGWKGRAGVSGAYKF
jgi:hypothetical protein